MKALARKSKEASRKLMSITDEEKNLVFDNLIMNLRKFKPQILKANQLDIIKACDNKPNSAMIDRLKLDDEKIETMIAGIEEIKAQKKVVGTYFDEFTNSKGMSIKKQRVPLGVILMIFESRPNVVIDCAALAIKSSNSIILKGGKEAQNSNQILGEVITESIKGVLPNSTISVLNSSDRSLVHDLLNCKKDIDVVIPRGGENLVHYVYENAKMPVIAHYKGLCHMYIDEFADKNKAIELVINAKTQRPGVCNAIETLLIHKDFLVKIGDDLVSQLIDKGTEIRVDSKFSKAIKGKFIKANKEDWNTEYLENILSIKTVDSIDEAIDHIAKFGSHHSESIVSENKTNCDAFLNGVDASCVMVNASTRFNDGSQLGLGAELGISTSKLHAYGPMGVEQMTTSRFVLEGSGHVRS